MNRDMTTKRWNWLNQKRVVVHLSTSVLIWCHPLLLTLTTPCCPPAAAGHLFAQHSAAKSHQDGLLVLPKMAQISAEFVLWQYLGDFWKRCPRLQLCLLQFEMKPGGATVQLSEWPKNLIVQLHLQQTVRGLRAGTLTFLFGQVSMFLQLAPPTANSDLWNWKGLAYFLLGWVSPILSKSPSLPAGLSAVRRSEW